MLFASFFWLLVIHALQKVRPQIRNLHKQNPAAKQRLRATLEKNKDLLSLIMSFSLYNLPTWRLEEPGLAGLIRTGSLRVRPSGLSFLVWLRLLPSALTCPQQGRPPGVLALVHDSGLSTGPISSSCWPCWRQPSLSLDFLIHKIGTVTTASLLKKCCKDQMDGHESDLKYRMNALYEHKGFFLESLCLATWVVSQNALAIQYCKANHPHSVA